MKNLNSFLVATFVSTLAVLAFTSTSQAAPVSLRKVSRITAPQEESTQHLIKTLKAKIENDCKALSTKDTLEVLGDKISDAFEYGGREVATGKAGCADLDLPCSAVPTKRVGTYTLRSHNLTLVRKNGGQRYYIKASTRWDLDLPQPQIDIQLDSRYCR